jgi:uncharacterized glyoxalase superfamily protein PhnB
MPTDHKSETNIFPSLFYDDAVAAIAWLCHAFGFTKRMVVLGPNGTVLHAELSLGAGVIMVGSSRPEEGRVSPRQLPATSQGLCVHVDDPDAHCAQAKACGATITRELRDEEYGSRGYMAKDLEGHSWFFGNYRPGAYWTEDATTTIEKR